MHDNQTDNTPRSEERSKVAHLLADWWIYAFLAIFIAGLVFLTYALTLRGEVITNFEKKHSAIAAPAHAAASATLRNA